MKTTNVLKTICVVLIAVMCVTFPLQSIYAARAETDIETLTHQLRAVSAYLARNYSQDVVPFTNSELRDSIRAGVLWFTQAQEENGHFKYEYAPFEGTYRAGDNIVRQTGALYVLGEIARRDEGDTQRVGPTMVRAMRYLETLTKDSGEKARCVTRSEASTRCPLGATALALTGTLGYISAFPHTESTYRARIHAYASHILASQKPTGGFRDLHAVHGSTASDAESPFSNGEALLALVRYYQFEENAETKEAIDSAFAHLRAQPFDNNLYLWMMAALKDMQALWPSDTYEVYANEFTEWRMIEAARLADRTRNYCAYAEGLASAASILGDNAALLEELAFRNKNHYALQLSDTDAFRVTNERGMLALRELKEPRVAIGGFLTGDNEPTQRIDFTQHCLGAYIQTLFDVGRGKL